MTESRRIIGHRLYILNTYMCAKVSYFMCFKGTINSFCTFSVRIYCALYLSYYYYYSIMSVSYTHLDVYKRQTIFRMKLESSEMAYIANKIYLVTEYNQICN